jgi:nucleotide-binding universal stress UspA family protein
LNEILVAVDGSKHSFKVVNTACDLAKSLSAGILLVYVMHLPEEEPEGVEEFERVEQYPDAYADYLKELGDE